MLRSMRRLIALILCAAAAAVPAAAAPKPPLCGLVAMGRVHFQKTGDDPDNSLKEPNAHPGIYVGAVILAKWSQLQPTPGALDTTTIDTGLAAIRRYNAAHPRTPLAAKLRIFAGPSAPAWAKSTGGAPVTVTIDGAPAQIGRFWAPPYRDAWRQLQQSLAARYDTDPLIAEVAASSCAVATAEPFGVHVFADSLPALRAAGFSDAAYKACLVGVADDYAAWQHTPIDYTFGIFRDTDSGSPVRDPEFTIQAMKTWRARMDGRGVLATHGLRAPLPAGLEPIYQTMQALGPPISFQTLQPHIDLDAAVRLGLAYRPTEIEIWDTAAAGGPAEITQPMLQSWSTGFTACPAR
jgi:hypothetical protein